ncbi:MAG: hypothetical protein K6G18_00645 [Treponema sp.]|nr:hypothetical protein [Treponema sp.]
MSVSENLKKAVEEKNIDDIRGCLWSCIAVDMNMTGRFKESLGYVLSNGINEYELFQDDDGTPFKTEASKDNFSELGGLLRVNFSKKKLDALRKMGLSLYPPKMESEGPKKNQGTGERPSSRSGEREKNRKEHMQKSTRESRVIGAVGGATFGAAGGAFAAAKFGAKVGGIIGGGLTGACVGAAIGYMLFREA